MFFVMFVYSMDEDNKRYAVMISPAADVQIHHNLDEGRVVVGHKDGVVYTADVIEHPIYVGPYYRALEKANDYAASREHERPFAHNVILKPKPKPKPTTPSPT